MVAPILGAIADYRAVKKPMLAAFLAIGVTATASMYLIGPGDWSLALKLFVAGNVGVAGTIVFYESLLPHLVPDGDAEALDRVSSAGYAIGYLGGGILLAINVLMIMKPSLLGIFGRRHRHPVDVRHRRGLVDRLFDPAVSARARTTRRMEGTVLRPAPRAPRRHVHCSAWRSAAWEPRSGSSGATGRRSCCCSPS